MVVVLIVTIATAVLTCYSFVEYRKSNLQLLKKESENIERIILEVFEYNNQLNSFIGRQIADHGAGDMEFISSLLRQASLNLKSESSPTSWTSFDWVDFNKRQLVNSRIGIRRERPDMSMRRYAVTAPDNPWHLEVSTPAIGNPSGMWVVPAGTGVTNRAGKFLGIVVIGFNVVEFSTKIQQKISQDVSFIVLDNESNIVFQSSDNDLQYNDPTYKSYKINENFREDNGKINQEILVGGINYSYYKKISGYPYVVLVGFDKSLIRSKFISLIAPRTIEFTSATLLFLIMLYVFKTRVSKILQTERELSVSLSRANQAKMDLLRTISHDLKNYIFGICGLLKIFLEKGKVGEELKEEYVDLINMASEHAREAMAFIEDLLDIQHRQKEELKLGELEECDIVELLSRIIVLHQNLADSGKLTIETSFQDNIPKLRCDIRRMKQIVVNLLGNSIKYTNVGGRIVVAVSFIASKNEVCIKIADSGIGMNEAEIAMAISGYGTKIDKSLLRKQVNSYGMGVPIAKLLVGLHNGRFEIKSNKSVGTEVNLYFGVTKNCPGSKEVTMNGAALSEFNFSGKSILVVEDNPVNRMVISATLKKTRCEIYYAFNGKEAIEMLDNFHIDLVLIDGEMPVMNGYEATIAIREGSIFKCFKNYRQIPIIALMSNSDEVTIKKSMDAGMNYHIAKGSSTFMVLEVISRYI